MKAKKSRFEQKEPMSILVNYHHYSDMTVLEVIKTYNDGSTSVDVARTNSPIYHIIEKRAFFCNVNRTIKHLIHNYAYIE